MTKVSEPLRRLATVLDAVGSSMGGLTSGHIAELTGLPIPTVHRTLRHLLALGYVENEGQGTPYRLGARLLHLIRHSIREEDIATVATPILQRLADTLGCTAFLARRAGQTLGNSVVEVIPKRRGRSIVLAGHDLPLHATASGKVFLASLSEAELAHHLSRGLEACRPATITDTELLRRHLALVRQRGYAFCKDECDSGVYAVAAPIHLVPQGVLFAAGAVGLKEQLFGRGGEKRLVKLAKATAQELTARLSGLEAPAPLRRRSTR